MSSVTLNLAESSAKIASLASKGMSTFVPCEYVFIWVGTILCDSDKASFATRRNQGMHIYKECLIDGINVVEEKYLETTYGAKKEEHRIEVRSALSMITDQIEGTPISATVAMDWCSSGVSINSNLMRDPIGMVSANGVNEVPGNFYNLLGDSLKESLKGKTTVPITRGNVKLACIPYFYAGESGIKHVFGKDAVEPFSQGYFKVAPGAHMLRAACKRAWNPNVNHYCWYMPDGYTPYICSEIPIKYSIEFNTKEGIKCSFTQTRNSMKPKAVDDIKTLGLGAHLTHSYDAYILRELNRRALFINEIKAGFAKLSRGQCNVQLPKKLEKVYYAFTKTKVASLEACYIMSTIKSTCTIEAQWYDYLEQEMNCFTEESEAFQVINIHDEFRCLPQHCNDLRRYAAYIYGSLYKGEVIAYMSKVLGLKQPNGTFLKAFAYNEDVYKGILCYDYLIS